MKNGILVPAARVCCGCKNEKPMDQFAKHKTGKYGHRSRCKECENADSAKWREANRDRHRAVAIEWYRSNRERQAANHKRWVAANRERANERTRRRIAKLRNARVESIDANAVYERDGWMCGLCGAVVVRGEESIDHILPISLGGDHTWDNVQLAHRRCNSAKGNRVA